MPGALMTKAYSEVSADAEFVQRHIGPDHDDQQRMLQAIGCESLDALVASVLPASIALDQALDLPPPRSEADVLNELHQLAARNSVLRSYIGQGYYGTRVPPVVLRNVLENPAWYTAYTPYQPEISQGRLEALLNFQTMVSDLTGLDIANASLLDEATAAAEAMALAWRVTTSSSKVFFASRHCHPQTLQVLATRAEPLGIHLHIADESLQTLPDCFGALFQYPHSLGGIVDYRSLIREAKKQETVVIMATDLLALALLTPPGEMGADIAVGVAQRFGVPMSFGGPHAGFIACRDTYTRNLPGRLVGVSRDTQGTPALRLALQTREQHIRREKATSNICTAQVLLAVMAGMYAVWHGPKGITRIAHRVALLTEGLRRQLHQMGLPVVNEHAFDTLLIETGRRTQAAMAETLAAGINIRPVDDAHVAVSLDETVTESDLKVLVAAFAKAVGWHAPLQSTLNDSTLAETRQNGIPEALQRQGEILAYPVFSSVKSETDMLRYLRSLADKDLALDRCMIPLGSCTMKLNATTEMIPITWPGFSQLHPYVPPEQAAGYQELLQGLGAALCEITGYDAVSVQPNSGAQGEFAGLLAIRAYHRAQGQHQRDICLIPASAHGTNPASAQMAGMHVLVVDSDANGQVDLSDLDRKIEQAGDRLAALMITYPSTHGVFEPAITSICDKVHQAGAQVYLDGANMNAMVGLAKPGWFGADVSHLNLHKTFCIPHGGGGPGVGPVAVRAHLAPFLPGSVNAHGSELQSSVGPVAAATYGSAGILPISYAYIALMGAQGLKQASRVAILTANYVAARLSPHYPLLYADQNNRVAHECILDIRPLTASTGVTVEDIAKRLMDYGFHAPTMGFPVPGTLMIEPTESEGLAELDRFIEAMIGIREEIAQIQAGIVQVKHSPLRNAPHPAQLLLQADWPYSYTREQAAYAVEGLRHNKYWPPVSRVDNVYGDRNLMTTATIRF